jgi:hypothetical protein
MPRTNLSCDERQLHRPILHSDCPLSISTCSCVRLEKMSDLQARLSRRWLPSAASRKDAAIAAAEVEAARGKKASRSGLRRDASVGGPATTCACCLHTDCEASRRRRRSTNEARAVGGCACVCLAAVSFVMLPLTFPLRFSPNLLLTPSILHHKLLPCACPCSSHSFLFLVHLLLYLHTLE